MVYTGRLPVILGGAKDLAIDGDKQESRLRFRIGPAIARLSMVTTLASFKEPATLARYADPMRERIQAVLAGTLQTGTLPEQIAALMLPAEAVDLVGPLLLSRTVPAALWALIDTENDPISTLLHLRV